MGLQKHIWIVNYYTSPPEFEFNERHLKFAHYLQESGYKVTIFSSGYLRVNDIDLVDNGRSYKRVTYGEYNFVHIKVRHYQGNGIDRMLSIVEFAWKILRHRNEFERPDVILQNMHAPFDYWISTCARKLKVRYIAEAWDLWPEAFVIFNLVSVRNPMLKWAYANERKMYERGSDIIFSFAGGIDYLKRKHWTKSSGGKIDESRVHYINNGMSIDDFDRNKVAYSLNDEDIENEYLFKIVYLGSIRLVNDVQQIIDALSLLSDYKDICLFIYGNGDQRKRLVKYCEDREISNVVFKQECIPLSHVPYVMSHSNLNILNYQKGFGDYGISSGKLFQSLAAGKPIVCNVNIAYDDIITDNQLGIAGGLNTPRKYADAILKIYHLDKENYDRMCGRVREVAKRFDFEVLSKQLKKVLEQE